MTVFWQGISFIWALIGIGGLAALFGLWAFIGYRALNREAAEDWAYRAKEGMVDGRTSEAQYIHAFKKVHAPRAPLYTSLALLTILILTIPAFSLINYGLYWLWKFTGESRVFEPGYLVWQFFIFFLMMMIWALIATGFARAYHRKAPGTMRHELLLARDEMED